MQGGIIGAGNVGRALALACMRAGHAVTISSREPEDARRVADEVGSSAAGSNAEAVANAEVVIPAVPFAALDGIPFDGFVAGDDAVAKGRVLDLVGTLGFRPIDAGPFVLARALEGFEVLNSALNLATAWSWQTGWKLLGPPDSAG